MLSPITLKLPLADGDFDRLCSRNLTVDLTERHDDFRGHSQRIFAHPRLRSVNTHAVYLDLDQFRSSHRITAAITEGIGRECCRMDRERNIGLGILHRPFRDPSTEVGLA